MAATFRTLVNLYQNVSNTDDKAEKINLIENYFRALIAEPPLENVGKVFQLIMRKFDSGARMSHSGRALAYIANEAFGAQPSKVEAAIRENRTAIGKYMRKLRPNRLHQPLVVRVDEVYDALLSAGNVYNERGELATSTMSQNATYRKVSEQLVPIMRRCQAIEVEYFSEMILGDDILHIDEEMAVNALARAAISPNAPMEQIEIAVTSLRMNFKQVATYQFMCDAMVKNGVTD